MGQTSLSYEGTVKISYKIKDKIIEKIAHNEGLEGLFKFLARAIAGADVYADRPTKFDLQEQLSGSSEWHSMLTAGAMITSVTYTKENSSWVNKLTATISRQQLNRDFQSNASYKFVLLSTNNTPMAQLAVDYASLSMIQGSTQAIVDWTLKITNKEEV